MVQNHQLLSLASIDLCHREKAQLVAGTGLLFLKLAEISKSLSLRDVLHSHRGGTWGPETMTGIGFPVLRTTNMRGVRVDVADPAWCEILPQQAESFTLQSGDVLVTKSSGSSDLVGKSALFVHPNDGQTYLFSNFTLRLRPNTSIIDPEYLAWFLRSPQSLAWRYDAQQNAVGLRNLNTGQFLEQFVPVPSLDIQQALVKYFDALEAGDCSNAVRCPLPPQLAEQRRIVARIEELAAKVEEAHGLRSQTTTGQLSLMSCAYAAVFDEAGWEVMPLEHVLAESPRNGLAPQSKAEAGKRRMLRINAVSSSATKYVDLEAHKLVDVDDRTAEPYVLQHDDVFIVRYNGDINRLAKAGIFKRLGNCDVVYPDKLMRLRPDRQRMTPDFLVYALGAPSVRNQIEDLGKTTAGQIGISGFNAKSFRVPLPPLSEQHRIVAYLDALQSKVDSLKQLQAQTAAELDALLPSILDKAFKGEL